MPATVLDRSDHFVTNLSQANFRLFDGKDEQQILSVALESAPVSVGIVFDASGSMKRAQQNSVEALRQFLQSADPRDNFCIIQVRDHPELTLDFTSDADRVWKQLAATPPVGATALIDAVYMAASHMKKAPHQRRMLLVLSDGEDNNSHYSGKELRRMLEEANVTIYSIGVGVRSPSFFYIGATGADLLTEMAEATGGRYFPAAYSEELPDIMQKIDIRYEYVIGFLLPPGSADGRYHRLQLRVIGPDRVRAFWRPGYYAPDSTLQAHRESARPRRHALLRPEPSGDAEPR